ncbi:HU family DNA-binding protein [bacterium]|nr:HU family DNA-binding protein [bacterium]
MTKAEMIDTVSQKTGLNKTQVGNVLDTIFETIQDALISGKKFTMTGFGTLYPTVRKSRPGRNPQTGEAMVIPGKLVAKFKAGKNLKEGLEGIEGISKWVNKT